MPAPAIELALPRTQDAPALARREVEREFGPELDEHVLDDAKLVVSELVANAVAHGAGDVTVRARLEDDRLRLEVSDEGSGPPVAIAEGRTDDDDYSGWGLKVVDALSVRYGAYAGSTHFWAELAVS